MKAICIEQYTGPRQLVYRDVLRPRPGQGEVLIRVHASAVTPTELTWPETWRTDTGHKRPFPIILGHEYSGVVAESGPGVEGVEAGQAVYGMNDWDRQGAQAEYCLASPDQLATKPFSIDHAQASEVPISALTAWQALFEHGQLQAGQRVLIQGGSGGVGAFAVQLAHWKGAYVFTTASTSHLDFARRLGADEVIDYTRTRFEDVARGVSLVLNTVGGDTLRRAWDVLQPGGILISIVDHPSPELAAEHQARGIYFVVTPDRTQLLEIARLIDSGQLHPTVAAVYPLAEAPQAYTRSEGGHEPGKVVLNVAH